MRLSGSQKRVLRALYDRNKQRITLLPQHWRDWMPTFATVEARGLIGSCEHKDLGLVTFYLTPKGREKAEELEDARND